METETPCASRGLPRRRGSPAPPSDSWLDLRVLWEVRGGARDEAARATRRCELASVPDGAAARDGPRDPALDLETLEDAAIGVGMVSPRAQLPLPLRIEQHHVRVHPDRDRSLASEPEDASWRGAAELHHAGEIEVSRAHAVGVEQREPILDPRRAVRNLGEVAHPHALLLVSEGAVVGADRVEHTIGEP